MLAGARELTAETVRALEPLIRELETGHYLAYLSDLPPERVADPERSWWLRRVEGCDDHEPEPDFPSWPGIEHFQAPRILSEVPPTYCAVLPSQPLDALDPRRSAATPRRSNRGERPAALLLAWTEER